MTRKQVFRSVFGLLPAVALLAALGCRGDDRPASVSGKVTYNDKPVTSGSVVFIAKDGKASYPGTVQPDGTYSIAHAPTGEVRVTFDNPPPPKPTGPENDPEVQEAAKKASLYVATPPKYKDPNQSGLSCTLKSGKNTYDVILK